MQQDSLAALQMLTEERLLITLRVFRVAGMQQDSLAALRMLTEERLLITYAYFLLQACNKTLSQPSGC